MTRYPGVPDGHRFSVGRKKKRPLHAVRLERSEGPLTVGFVLAEHALPFTLFDLTGAVSSASHNDGRAGTGRGPRQRRAQCQRWQVAGQTRLHSSSSSTRVSLSTSDAWRHPLEAMARFDETARQLIAVGVLVQGAYVVGGFN